MGKIMGKKMRAAIIGSTGYGGVELIRLLLLHPMVEITSVVSSSSAGVPIAEGYPHLTEIIVDNLDAVDIGLIREKADVVFMATPPGISAELAPVLLEAGLKVIDLSGDFRLPAELYEHWYQRNAPDAAFLAKAVYGLTEVFGDEVRGHDFISNPGCFTTTALLGLIPAVAAGWIDPNSIIIDAKSGVSGAGRGLGLSVHFSEINENFKAYKVNRHQHTPEIEHVLGRIAGREVVTTFTAHLVPMTRGILCTMYAQLTGDAVAGGSGLDAIARMDAGGSGAVSVDDVGVAAGSSRRTDEQLVALYRDYYKGRKFVRVRDPGKWPATKEVWGSNYCDIGFSIDERTGRVTIISVTDNLVKGAAGQAIQNLNVMMGWDETLGLDIAPTYP